MTDHTKGLGRAFSAKRGEEVAKTHDVISRAKAAAPLTGGADRLDRPPAVVGDPFGHNI